MSPPRTPRDRVPYSAIVDRPALVLPGDARMIVWTIVNVEDWGIERPMPRTVLSPPMGQPLLPDLPNWAWHEYGMRVGFWRLLECMQKFGVTPTLAINGIVCRNYPRIAQAAKDAGWEFMGHGWLQTPMHKVEDQRAAIRETIDAIRAFTGKAAARLGEPRSDRNLRHHRPSRRGRHRVRRRLGARRPAGLHRDRARPGAFGSLHGRGRTTSR